MSLRKIFNKFKLLNIIFIYCVISCNIGFANEDGSKFVKEIQASKITDDALSFPAPTPVTYPKAESAATLAMQSVFDTLCLDISAGTKMTEPVLLTQEDFDAGKYSYLRDIDGNPPKVGDQIFTTREGYMVNLTGLIRKGATINWSAITIPDGVDRAKLAQHVAEFGTQGAYKTPWGAIENRDNSTGANLTVGDLPDAKRDYIVGQKGAEYAEYLTKLAAGCKTSPSCKGSFVVEDGEKVSDDDATNTKLKTSEIDMSYADLQKEIRAVEKSLAALTSEGSDGAKARQEKLTKMARLYTTDAKKMASALRADFAEKIADFEAKLAKIIPTDPEHAKLTKNLNSIKALNGLTDLELVSLRTYTGAGYVHMNEILRGNTGMQSYEEWSSKDFSGNLATTILTVASLASAPKVTQDVSRIEGLSTIEGMARIEGHRGLPFHPSSFVSNSSFPLADWMKANCVVVLTKDAEVIDISGLSMYAGEDEVLRGPSDAGYVRSVYQSIYKDANGRNVPIWVVELDATKDFKPGGALLEVDDSSKLGPLWQAKLISREQIEDGQIQTKLELPNGSKVTVVTQMQGELETIKLTSDATSETITRRREEVSKDYYKAKRAAQISRSMVARNLFSSADSSVGLSLDIMKSKLSQKQKSDITTTESKKIASANFQTYVAIKKYQASIEEYLRLPMSPATGSEQEQRWKTTLTAEIDQGIEAWQQKQYKLLEFRQTISVNHADHAQKEHDKAQQEYDDVFAKIDQAQLNKATEALTQAQKALSDAKAAAAPKQIDLVLAPKLKAAIKAAQDNVDKITGPQVKAQANLDRATTELKEANKKVESTRKALVDHQKAVTKARMDISLHRAETTRAEINKLSKLYKSFKTMVNSYAGNQAKINTDILALKQAEISLSNPEDIAKNKEALSKLEAQAIKYNQDLVRHGDALSKLSKIISMLSAHATVLAEDAIAVKNPQSLPLVQLDTNLKAKQTELASKKQALDAQTAKIQAETKDSALAQEVDRLYQEYQAAKQAADELTDNIAAVRSLSALVIYAKTTSTEITADNASRIAARRTALTSEQQRLTAQGVSAQDNLTKQKQNAAENEDAYTRLQADSDKDLSDESKKNLALTAKERWEDTELAVRYAELDVKEAEIEKNKITAALKSLDAEQAYQAKLETDTATITKIDTLRTERARLQFLTEISDLVDDDPVTKAQTEAEIADARRRIPELDQELSSSRTQLELGASEEQRVTTLKAVTDSLDAAASLEVAALQFEEETAKVDSDRAQVQTARIKAASTSDPKVSSMLTAIDDHDAKVQQAKIMLEQAEQDPSKFSQLEIDARKQARTDALKAARSARERILGDTDITTTQSKIISDYVKNKQIEATSTDTQKYFQQEAAEAERVRKARTGGK
ncbi:MAG: hypothetical protein KBD64_04510 [Gammaproteobacteria bacterium]|nr:hypothetical protein [Gammaproteobacteria bacterium]